MKTKLYNSYIYLHLPRTFIEFLKHNKYLREYIKVFISNMPLKVTVELICIYSCKNEYDTMDAITNKIIDNYKYNKYFTRENQEYLKNILTLYYFWLQTANYTIFHSRGYYESLYNLDMWNTENVVKNTCNKELSNYTCMYQKYNDLLKCIEQVREKNKFSN